MVRDHLLLVLALDVPKVESRYLNLVKDPVVSFQDKG